MQHAADRVADVDPNDLVSVAEVTLPRPEAQTLPIQFDQVRNAWIISAPNANLKILGGFQAEVQPGVVGVGFGIAIEPSFLQVALHHGRYVLRDGYHRAFGLLSRGVTRAPAFVRDFGVAELGVGQGLFSTAVYLGPRPPRLIDFLDEEVSTEVEVPVVQKMLVIQGLELSPLA